MDVAQRTSAAARPQSPIPTEGGVGLDRCERVAARLKASFQALIRALPEQASTVAEMSRFLGVGRAVCQRITLALRSGSGPIDVLQRFPGIKGLEQFLDAAERKRVDAGAVAGARAALDEYAALIGAAGGSQRRLIATLGARRSGGAARRASAEDNNDNQQFNDSTAARESFFNAAQGITGTRCHARIEVLFARVRPDMPDHIEIVAASGLVGATADVGGTPIARVTRSTSGQAPPNSIRTDLETKAPILGISPGALLKPFSTDPIPSVISRAGEGMLVQVFNPEGRSDRPLDIIVGSASSPDTKHPALDTPPIFGVGTIIGMPSRWLLMDIYLERSLARGGTPQIAVFRLGITGPLAHSDPDCRWFDRLPEDPPLELLGPGIARRPSRAYPRCRELAAHLLERAGWAADQFIGFRCEVEYPIWETEYLMSFRYDEPPALDIPPAFRRS